MLHRHSPEPAGRSGRRDDLGHSADRGRDHREPAAIASIRVRGIPSLMLVSKAMSDAASRPGHIGTKPEQNGHVVRVHAPAPAPRSRVVRGRPPPAPAVRCPSWRRGAGLARWMRPSRGRCLRPTVRRVLGAAHGLVPRYSNAPASGAEPLKEGNRPASPFRLGNEDARRRWREGRPDKSQDRPAWHPRTSRAGRSARWL